MLTLNHMPSRRDLPYLLTLLEDDSWIVRKHVSEALRSFGPKLAKVVSSYKYGMDPQCLEVLEEILDEIKEETFSSGWMNWLEISNTKLGLERAMINLSFLQFGEEAFQIELELDTLAEEFLLTSKDMSVDGLMKFIFEDKKFKSPGDRDQNHLHDSLLFTLRQRVGSQISLSCLIILLGWRIGLELHGIHIQGNFLPISFEGAKMQMYNTYNAGLPIKRSAALYIEEAFKRNCILPSEMRAEVHEIVSQILRNTIEFYHRRGKSDDANLYAERYNQLMDTLKARGMVE